MDGTSQGWLVGNFQLRAGEACKKQYNNELIVSFSDLVGESIFPDEEDDNGWKCMMEYLHTNPVFNKAKDKLQKNK